MAIYEFRFITSAQASAYIAFQDELRFTGVDNPTASNVRVSGTSLTIISTGQQVSLGPGASGEVFTFPDGSTINIPSIADETLVGGAGSDYLTGDFGRDSLSGAGGSDSLGGGALNDVISGGTGADTLSGGTAPDTYIFAPGDSGVVEGQLDRIVDWEAPFERIVFSTPMRGGDYTELVATSYDAALAAANQQIATGAMDIVAVAVGTGVIVFADTRNDNGGADDAIFLVGRNLDFVAPDHFVGYTPAGPPPPPPPPPGPTPSAGVLTFESITPNQALGYNAAANDLLFSHPSAGSTALFIGFQTDGNVQVVSGAGGGNRIVVFGPGIYGEANLIFPDNTRVVIGSPGDDLLMGAHTIDLLAAGPGADTLNGGGNPDRLYGGAGADLFVVSSTSATIFDSIYDWEAIDRVTFGGQIAGTQANYVELESGNAAAAESLIRAGTADYVAVQSSDPFGSVVVIYADVAGMNVMGSRVALRGATLASVDFSNIVAAPALAFPALPPIPGTSASDAPGPVTYVGQGRSGAGGTLEGNMDLMRIGALQGGLVSAADDDFFRANSTQLQLELTGTGFTYQINNGILLDMPSGSVSRIDGYFRSGGSTDFVIHLGASSTPAQTVFGWILNDQTAEAFATLLAGADNLSGGEKADLLRGLSGDDTLGGFGGDDILWGGAGNDVIYALAPPGRLGGERTGSTYLRGEDGDDWIGGGPGFDDINGNMGADTAGGAGGNDWVVGGKDGDLLFGDAGDDLVYGNLGSDTCHGGEGADIVRGGQGDDVVQAGAGADFVSGDLGNDTLSGGPGADTFNTFAATGLDRVLDFSIADGDRVQLAPGTQYTVAQAGGDTVISMTGGGQMILVGVTASSLPAGWIFGA